MVPLEELNRERQRLIAKWRSHPYFLEWARKMQASRTRGDETGPPARSPTDVIGEMGSWIIGLAVSGEDGGRAWDMPTGVPEDADYARVRTARLMDKAIPFLWVDGIYQAAIETAVPRHSVGKNLLPHPICWWTLEHAFSLKDRTAWLDGILVSQMSGWIEIIQMGERRDRSGLWWRTSRLLEGRVFPDDYPSDERTATGQMLGMLSFLNSPFIGATNRRGTRAERRALSKIGLEDVPDVQFVALRQPAPVEGNGRDAHTSTVEWQRQWIVRGHHRAQWYPSLQHHKLIWIAPYIKGPEDKPLAGTIYKVAR